MKWVPFLFDKMKEKNKSTEIFDRKMKTSEKTKLNQEKFI